MTPTEITAAIEKMDREQFKTGPYDEVSSAPRKLLLLQLYEQGYTINVFNRNRYAPVEIKEILLAPAPWISDRKLDDN